MPNAVDTPTADASATAVAEPAVDEAPIADDAAPAEAAAPAPANERPWLGSRPEGIASPERRALVAAPSVQSLGPAGKQRVPWLVPVLSVLTLGVYALIWHRRVNTEMRNFDPRMHVSPGRSTLAVAVPWAIGLLISLAGAARIVLDQMHVTLPFDPHFTLLQGYYLLAGIAVVPYLELLLSFSAVALVMTAERLRTCEECAGRTTDVHVRAAQVVLWLAVPITGGLIFQHIVQRRLNNVWHLAQPTLASRISQY